MHTRARWGLVLAGDVPDSPSANTAQRRHAQPGLAQATNNSRPFTARRESMRAPRRPRPQRRSRSGNVVVPTDAAAMSTEGPLLALEAWERDAVSLHRSVRREPLRENQVEVPHSAPQSSRLLFSVLAGATWWGESCNCIPSHSDARSATQHAPSVVPSPYLLSFLLQTSVLTTTSVAVNARECAEWLVQNVLERVSVSGGTRTATTGPVCAFLVSVMSALGSAGRLRTTELAAQWLLEVFLHVAQKRDAPPSVSPPRTTRSAVLVRCDEWQLANGIVECVHQLDGLCVAATHNDSGSTAALDAVEAAADDTTMWHLLCTDLYVHALQRILNEWNTDPPGSATADEDPRGSASAMLKLCMLLRHHPNFHSPDSLDLENGPSSSVSGVNRVLALQATWQQLLRHYFDRASALRDGCSIEHALLMSYLLNAQR